MAASGPFSDLPRCLLLRRYCGQPDIDALVRVAPLIERVGRFADLIDSEPDHSLFATLREAKGTGRPLGSGEFVAKLERLTGRRLQWRQPGC